MKLLMFVLTVTAMALVQTVRAQDFDPTEQILPFSDEAELIAVGRYADAADALAVRGGVIQSAIAEMGIDWERIADDDPRLARYLTAVVNLSIGQNLACHALAGLFDSQRKLETCVEEWDKENRYLWCAIEPGLDRSDDDVDTCIAADRMADHAWTPKLQSLAAGLIFEARERYDHAIDAYAQVSGLASDIWRFELLFTDRRDDVVSAARLLDDYVTARRYRLTIATSGDELPNPNRWSTQIFCPSDYPATCPVAFMTLQRIAKIAADGYSESIGLDEVPLGRPQHWLGLENYEHPLLWQAAIAHRHGDVHGVEHALSFQDEISDTMTSDVAFVISLFGGDADYTGVVPDQCNTAGCRYFLAQHLYGLGHIDDGHDIIAESQELCAGTESLMCAVLQHAQAKIDAGRQP